jgi:SAM-dependent methyltransferase
MSASKNVGTGMSYDFLCVDEFLSNIVEARALKSALELGLIDHLHGNLVSTLDSIAAHCRGDDVGLRFLLDLLESGRVVERFGDSVRLTEGFMNALRFRDLLEAKLDFANLVAPDFVDLFTTLIEDSGRFFRESRLLDLFDYHRAFEDTPENRARTKRWVRITTCLTRYEAQACLQHHDFGRYARMLDIGGNSGEFVLQVCKRYPDLRGTVFDLPLVCDIGREHVGREPEAGRITFAKGNALVDSLPTGFDVVAFKSMLHDWPEREARRLLERACRSLNPGGTLLVYERGPIDARGGTLPYSVLPMLLFFRSFRPPAFYATRFEALGLTRIDVQTLRLDIPFFLVTGCLAG